MPAYFHLSAPLHLDTSAAAEQQKLSTTVPWRGHGFSRDAGNIILTNLAFGGGKADCEVGGHVEPRQHSAVAVLEGEGNLFHAWPGGLHRVGR